MEKNNAPQIWGLQPIYEQKLDFYIQKEKPILLMKFTPQSKE